MENLLKINGKTKKREPNHQSQNRQRKNLSCDQLSANQTEVFSYVSENISFVLPPTPFTINVVFSKVKFLYV